jgi:hypothetical protein
MVSGFGDPTHHRDGGQPLVLVLFVRLALLQSLL